MKDCQNLTGFEQDKCVLTKLSFYEYNINGDTFNKNFIKSGGTERMANHLWEKFVGKRHSILGLWGEADKENREILVKVIDEGYK